MTDRSDTPDTPDVGERGFDFLRDDEYLHQIEEVAPVRRGLRGRRRWWYTGIGVVIVGAVLIAFGIFGLVVADDEEPDSVPSSTTPSSTTPSSTTTTPTTATSPPTTGPTTTAAAPTTTSPAGND